MPVCQWTDGQRVSIAEARSFKDLGNRMVPVVYEMAEEADGLLHIVCGPITTGGLGGNMRNNLIIFETAINVVAARYNCYVFNQLPLQDKLVELYVEWEEQHPGDTYCWPIMEDVYDPIFRTDCFEKSHFIPGWDSSTGTSWERSSFFELDVPMNDIPLEWLVHVVPA